MLWLVKNGPHLGDFSDSTTKGHNLHTGLIWCSPFFFYHLNYIIDFGAKRIFNSIRCSPKISAFFFPKKKKKNQIRINNLISPPKCRCLPRSPKISKGVEKKPSLGNAVITRQSAALSTFKWFTIFLWSLWWLLLREGCLFCELFLRAACVVGKINQHFL